MLCVSVSVEEMAIGLQCSDAKSARLNGEKIPKYADLPTDWRSVVATTKLVQPESPTPANSEQTTRNGLNEIIGSEDSATAEKSVIAKSAGMPMTY
jgi:hypothetical protein